MMRREDRGDRFVLIPETEEERERFWLLAGGLRECTLEQRLEYDLTGKVPQPVRPRN